MVDPHWHNFFELGIPFIDEDHKGLISLIENLEKGLGSLSESELKLQLDRLLEKTREHFRNEEKYLEKINFPGHEFHKIFHESLLSDLAGTVKSCGEISSMEKKEECIRKMVHLIIEEILKGDNAFKSFLEDEGHITNQ